LESFFFVGSHLLFVFSFCPTKILSGGVPLFFTLPPFLYGGFQVLVCSHVQIPAHLHFVYDYIVP